MNEKLKKYYPPGYDYAKEWGSIILCFVIGTIFSMALFFIELTNVMNWLYDTVLGERTLMKGAIAQPFIELMEGQLVCFAPLFIFILIMMFYHYAYYYQGTKSIYVIRRLSSKKYVIKSCIEGTCAGVVIGLAGIWILWILYYLIYQLAIPSECMPRLV